MTKVKNILALLGILFLVQIILLCHWLPRLLLLDLVDPNDPKSGYVLTNALHIAGVDGSDFRLPRGTILYGPCRHDLVHTDLGDPRVWKLIVDSTDTHMMAHGRHLSEISRDDLFEIVTNAQAFAKMENREQDIRQVSSEGAPSVEPSM